MTVAQRTYERAPSHPEKTSAHGWVSGYVRTAVGIDVAIALAAGVFAFLVRFGSDVSPWTVEYVAFSALLPVVWPLGLALARTYEARFLGVGPDEFRRVFNTGISFTAGIAILAYATKTDVARGFVVLALPLATIGTLVGRYLLRKRLHRLRRAGRCTHRAVAVGTTSAVGDLVRQLRREPYHGVTVVGACLPPEELAAATDIEGAPVLGDFTAVDRAASVVHADTVTVLASAEMQGSTLRRLAWQLERTDTDLVVSPGLLDVAGPRTTIRPVAGLPLLHVEHPELAGTRRLLKTAFDRLAAASALILLAPVLLTVVLLVRASSSGPALFRQTRVGKDGRLFPMYKFRSMYVDAEARKAQLTHRNEHDGVLFKIRDDPRVTPLGKWLRRYSLDELPQLVNVLLGHMSLVGPRPPLPAEVAEYGDDVRRRLVVKPGLTGLWQISGRSDLSWEESVRLDLRYVENWSLTMDLLILWKTGSAVVRAPGAY